MRQVWHDLLFAHWPISADVMRAHVPPELDVDTFAGSAWIGVVPFRMSGVRLRGLPAMPGIRAFPELNVRTYVRVGDRPGVWFFSLDAASALAVSIARAWFHLPYFRARMRCEEAGGPVGPAAGERVTYESVRTHPGAPSATWRGTYGPTGPVEFATPGSLEHWLTERYCLYACSPAGRVWRGEIHHDPWPLQPAEARVQVDTMAAATGIALPDAAPHLLFARRLDVRIWALKRLALRA